MRTERATIVSRFSKTIEEKMGLLEGFEPIKRVKGVPTVTISKDGVAFTTAILEKLGKPHYVIPMIDRSGRRFAIVASNHETDDTRLFYKQGRKSSYGIRWSDRDLRSTLATMMGWNLKSCGYRVEGVYDFEENAFIFDLNKAKPYGKGAADEREE